MLLPVGLDQLREEGCQIRLLLLQHARCRAGGGGCVQVHDFSGTESLKFNIVKHGLVSVSSTICVEMLSACAILNSSAGFFLSYLEFDANVVLRVKHACVAFKGACERSETRPIFPTHGQKVFACCIGERIQIWRLFSITKLVPGLLSSYLFFFIDECLNSTCFILVMSERAMVLPNVCE